MPEQQQGSASPPTPAMYSVVVEDRPIRIRSNEMFLFQIDLHEPRTFSEPGFYRLYMMGIWYRSLGYAAPQPITTVRGDGSHSTRNSPPRAVLRPLKVPLYSTLQLPMGNGDGPALWPGTHSLFRRPLDQSDGVTGETLTELQTNMMQSCQLGTPEEFDLWGFRAEMSLAQPIEERIRFLEACTWRWGFGAGSERWFGGPLTQIPCASTILGPEARTLHQPKAAAGQERREAGVRRIRS